MRDAIHLACQLISQQCFSLIPNQYHSPASSTVVSYQINISHQPQPSEQRNREATSVSPQGIGSGTSLILVLLIFVPWLAPPPAQSIKD